MAHPKPALDPTAIAEPWYAQPRWIALVALVLRLVYILWRHTYQLSPVNDHYAFGLETGSIARSIATGEGFASPFRGSTGPTAWIAPVYPYLCAAMFRIFGLFTPLAAIAIFSINSLFAALTCWPLIAIGRRTVGARAAIAAAWIWAITPQMMKWAAEWVWEVSLSALLVALLVHWTLLLAEASTRRRWLTVGALWGFAALVNPALLTLAPFSVAWLWRRRKGDAACGVSTEERRETELLRGLGFAVLIAGTMAAPWMVRNRVVFGRWVFLRSNFGFELHLGNYHNSFGMGWGGFHPSVHAGEYARYRQLGELAYVAEHQREAMQFVRQYPREFVELCGKRVVAFWDGSALGYAYDPPPWTPRAFLFVSVLAGFGLLWATRQRVHGAGLFWWILLYPLPYYITYPQPRYRHAVEPLMLLLCTYLASQPKIRK